MIKEYQWLTREEKKEIRKKYRITKKGKVNTSIYTRLLIEALLCIGSGGTMLIYSILEKKEWFWYSLSILLIIGGIIYLVSRHVLVMDEYNKFIKSQTKKTKK